jgi:TATA-box binding protein (TBP) (component of TFIID and TFIIIB)
MNFKVNTDSILHNLPLNESIIKIEKRGVLRRGESSRDKIKRRTKQEVKTKTGFGHNSITIVMMNSGKGFPMKEITIKIFQNGVFHLTGILDDSYDSECMRILCNTLWEIPSAIQEKPLNYEIVRRRVVLMNYTTELNPKTTVPRETFYNILKKVPEINVSYNPDVYPGIKIQFENNWTAKIFRTGKIILTGITTKKHCEEFVVLLDNLLKKYLPKTK